MRRAGRADMLFLPQFDLPALQPAQ